MGLLTEVLQRLSAQRLVELSQPQNPGGLKATTLSGTVTVTNGSTTVTGSGTAFTSAVQASQVIQFSAQPGVSYVVSAVGSATSLTLANGYFGVTTAGGTATLPAINYVTLQNAVYDAQAHFQAKTNFAFDDVTANANTNPLTLNKCIWAGVALVVAYLYEYRGRPTYEGEVDAAWRIAEKRLQEVLGTFGDGAWGAPNTDSVFQPSYGPVRLPVFDNARFGDISPFSPGPTSPDGGGGAASSPNDWVG